MNEVHPLQIVVHHELQAGRHVALMWLKDLVHDGTPGKEFGGSFHHGRVVEENFDKVMLPWVVAVHRSPRHLQGPVDMLQARVSLIHRYVDGFVQRGSQPVHKALALSSWHGHIHVGKDPMQMKATCLTSRGATKHPQHRHLAHLGAPKVGDQGI